VQGQPAFCTNAPRPCELKSGIHYNPAMQHSFAPFALGPLWLRLWFNKPPPGLRLRELTHALLSFLGIPKSFFTAVMHSSSSNWACCCIFSCCRYRVSRHCSGCPHAHLASNALGIVSKTAIDTLSRIAWQIQCYFPIVLVMF
jgi:hypothetical protein